MSSNLSDNLQKMKVLLERVDANRERFTDKSHPQYSLVETDRIYKALKEKKQQAIDKIALSTVSEADKENLRNLITEIEMRLSLVGPSISDELLRLEGGKLRRRKTKRSRKARRSNKARRSTKARRSKRRTRK